MKNLILNFIEKQKILLTFMFFCLLMNFCYANAKTPYFIDGKINSQADNSEICSVDLNFYNKSEKKVIEYTVVFFLFDSNGEVYANTKNNFVFTVKNEILPNENFECSISLDDFFYEDCCDDLYSLDYLYVSQIKYDDGSAWQDKFGLSAF